MYNKKVNPNDPAFSGPTKDGYAGGLTAHQFISTMAMAGMIASCESDPQRIAQKSGEMADAMIEGFNRWPEPSTLDDNPIVNTSKNHMS